MKRKRISHPPFKFCIYQSPSDLYLYVYNLIKGQRRFFHLFLPFPSSSLFPQVEGKHGAVKRLQTTGSLGYV